MSWTSLQMISLGSLLLLGNQPLCAGGSQCIGEDAIAERLQRLQKKLTDSGPQKTSDGKETRSLSPWTYREDTNDTRHPRVIYMAKCLHKGCIINGQENDAYNSVEVSTHMTVLYRDKCARDPSKHVLTLTSIPVSVSCTCVVPKY